jgi:hypothetical protein
MLEDGAAAARRAPPLRELARERFDGIENGRDLQLVVRQDDAFRERIADDQNPLRRESLKINRPPPGGTCSSRSSDISIDAFSSSYCRNSPRTFPGSVLSKWLSSAARSPVITTTP